ncbi:Fungal specific transcription factor domain [Ceratobasidium sp. AG-Ba]|nr:Fungal specific transcription factor domain [Ceratobasidium sp. AG-Ba]
MRAIRMRETDARRTISRQLLESLRAKITSLEAEVERLNAEKLTAQVNSPSTSQRFSHGFNNVTSNESPASPKLQSKAITLEMSYASPQSSDPANTPIYQYIFQISNTDTTQNQSAYDQLNLDCDWSRHLPELPGVLLSREDHDVLLLRGFKYGTSWLLGLVPENFLSDMLLYLTTEQRQPFSTLRLEHYTPLLHCSLLAFASAFSENPAIKAPSTRARFALHAKQWLDNEFKYPGPCLARALMLLAEYHCGVGQKEVGYMYMGMSIRATRSTWSKDYGHAEGGRYSNPVDGCRQSWSAFCHDKIMALGYSQECELPVLHQDLPLPPIDNELDRRPWPLEPTSTSTIGAAPPRITTITFQETCRLMVIASHVIDIDKVSEEWHY